MKVIYRNCKEIIRRRSQQPGYDKSQHGLYVQYGSYKVPTCCSVLVNLLQFILTVSSVLIQKGDPAAFWQPAIYSQGVMKTNFYAVQDVDQFWRFLEHDIGQNLFFDAAPCEDDDELLHH